MLFVVTRNNRKLLYVYILEMLHLDLGGEEG